MNKCIELMMMEHDLIVQVLASLKAMTEQLSADGPVSRRDVADYARFFRDFADRCHHGKEEDRLFVQMIEAGFPRESGPIAVMLAEHDAGRNEVQGLGAIGEGSGPLTEEEKLKVASYALEFIPLLYTHIQKENNVLYPMAQNSIPEEQFARLDEACDAFDKELRSSLDVDALKALAADLMRRYPANASKLSMYAGCGSCH